MLTNHLVVLTKAPLYGASKTRLGSQLGYAKACQISRALSGTLIKRVSKDRRWSCTLAVTPDTFSRVGRFWPHTVARLAQGRGNLGDRMSRLVKEYGRGPIVIIGTDIPTIQTSHIVSAFKALGTSHFVFGPSYDGGFWLIGSRRRPTNDSPFANVTWSSPGTLAQTINNISTKYKIAFLETLEDIDDIGSWYRWQRTGNSAKHRQLLVTFP